MTPFILEQPGSSLLEWHPDFQRICKRVKIYRVPQPNSGLWRSLSDKRFMYVVNKFQKKNDWTLQPRCLYGLDLTEEVVSHLQWGHAVQSFQQSLPSHIYGVNRWSMAIEETSYNVSLMKGCQIMPPSSSKTGILHWRSKANGPLFELPIHPQLVLASAQEHRMGSWDECQAPWHWAGLDLPLGFYWGFSS